MCFPGRSVRAGGRQHLQDAIEAVALARRRRTCLADAWRTHHYDTEGALFHPPRPSRLQLGR